MPVNKTTAWVGLCPVCNWETFQRTRAATRETIRLHMSAVHREKMPDEE